MVATRTVRGEVRGDTVEVCIEGVMSVFQSRMRNILDEHGIDQPDPQPQEWYSLEKFIRILELIGTDVGENALTKVGEATPEFADWTSDPTSPAEALESLTDVYNEIHKNADGEYSFEQTGEDEGRVISTTPYPDPWERGVLKGSAEKYVSHFTRINTIEPSENRVVFEVSW